MGFLKHNVVEEARVMSQVAVTAWLPSETQRDAD